MNQQARFVLPDIGDQEGFTVRDFCAMADLGAFADMRAELVNGVIEKMAPAHGEHSRRNASILVRLANLLGDHADIGVDLMVMIDDCTVRGADIAVAHGKFADRGAVPGDALMLVVEIADTTLPRDLIDKAHDYARAGVAHYWVVDLNSRAIHVKSGLADGIYTESSIVRFGEPLAVPGTAKTIVID